MSKRRKRPRPTPGQRPTTTALQQVEPARPVQGVEALVGFIATGSLDEHLGTISRAVLERRRHLARRASIQAMGRVDVGDRVRITDEVRPMYLRGATGTVTGWTGKNVVVLLDLPAGRGDLSQVRCPPLCLEVVQRAPRRVVP